MRSKKNWNLFRRLKLINLLFITCLICLITIAGCDKEDMLYGSWNLHTVLMNGEPLNDSLQYNVIPKYTFYTFFYANSLTVRTYTMGMSLTSPDGYYAYNKSSINMRYSLYEKKYDISAKITKLTRKELNLEYKDRGNNYFLKLYSE